VFRCSAETEKGCFVGYGTSNSQRDSRLADSLIELAETRAVARSLRFAGYGVEYTGIEEVLHVQDNEAYNAVGNGNGKIEARHSETSNGTATQAQIRALHALARKAKYHDEDVASLIAPSKCPALKTCRKKPPRS
jgi:aminopeptidase N